jgi:hypothetical protein
MCKEGVHPVMVEIFYELAMNWQHFKSLVQGVHLLVVAYWWYFGTVIFWNFFPPVLVNFS